MNKGVTITLVSILIIILLSLIGIFIFLLNSNFEFGNMKVFSGQSNNLIEEKEINSFKNLNITTNVADIEIEKKILIILKYNYILIIKKIII